jgi:para-nitrobenzyl esterase
MVQHDSLALLRHAMVGMVLIAALAGCSSDDAARRDGETPSSGPLAETPYGRYAPAPAREGVVAYRGVPYAAPPIGARRWREPATPERSNRVVRATEFGLTCRQRADSNEVASSMPQGEDCLTLNVWRRAGSPAARPVMIWIHGGANVSGGTADPFYDGHDFVRDNDVVLVSINYRLGPFGFLDLSAVGDSTFARSRNLGVLDQLAALTWVKENIGAFGGDSASITVFGESAGGSAIMRLLAMPLARGLFHRAIIESGGPANIRVRGVSTQSGLASSRALARDMMAMAKVGDVAALQALDADSVLAIAERIAAARGDALGVSTWGARADSVVLPEDLFGDIRRGVNPGVQLLIGTNEDEMLYFRLYDADFERTLMREYHASSSAMGRSFKTVRDLADRYIAGSTDPMRYVDFAGEYWLRQPSIVLAEGNARHADTYMYLWTWDSRVPGLGACHAIELPFVFGHLTGKGVEKLTGPNPPARLSRRIQAAWTAFATTGNPTAPGEPEWPRYAEPTRATLIIDDGPWRVEHDPKREARQLLRGMYDVGR